MHRASLWLVVGGVLLTSSAYAQAPVGLTNPSFERGLEGWVKTGTAFDSQPTYRDNVLAVRVGPVTLGGSYWTDLPYPVGNRGDFWVGTYESRPNGSIPTGRIQGDGPTGTLTSHEFRLPADARFISFLIGGGGDVATARIELLEARSGTYVAIPGVPSKTGHHSEILRRDWWSVGALDRSKAYVIRIIDHATGHWGHINVDDIRFEAAEPSALRLANGQPAVLRTNINNQSLWTDYDAPLWGAADLHTHPMSHLSMGGKLMHGAPDIGSLIPAGMLKIGNGCNARDVRATSLAEALGECSASHGGWGVDNSCGDHLRAAAINFAVNPHFVHRTTNAHGDHAKLGYPAFLHWPHFSSVTHQQMYVDWIRRAHEGGLRVLVALAVNNELLAEVALGPGKRDDRASADLQIDEIRAFVRRHDFMREVQTPAEFRQAIKDGKLAVVVGMEVDNIGNFNYGNPALLARPEEVKKEIQRLHARGVRYIFPIHFSDNVFGGAAVKGALFNFSNRFARTRPLPTGVPFPPGFLYKVMTARDPSITFRLDSDLLNFFVLTGGKGLIDALGRIPFPPAFDAFKCPVPNLSCLPHFKLLSSMLSPDSEWDQYRFIKGGHVNAQGLTPAGELALAEMMRLGMIIDIDHMSDLAANRALEIARRFQYPVTSGHTGLREMPGAKSVDENNRASTQLTALGELGGVMGVGWANGHAGSFLEAYRFAMGHTARTGRAAPAFSLGSDINGFEGMPRPRHDPKVAAAFGVERPAFIPQDRWNRKVEYGTGPGMLRQFVFEGRKYDYNVDGIAHIGLYPDIYQDLANLGMTQAERTEFFRAADAFARMWDKIEVQRHTVR
jgi:microsomal dipeptidase-like Zn-dependent dipeptidase